MNAERRSSPILVLSFALVATACGTPEVIPTAVAMRDAGVAAERPDASRPDASIAASRDAGSTVPDAATFDAGMIDASTPPDPPFESCAGNSDAHGVFNAFWSAFDRDYALFDLRLPNDRWGDIGRRACERVTDGMSDDALFDLLIEMARHLDDGHSSLTATDLDREEDAWVNAYPHYDSLYELEGNVGDRYGELSWAANDWFAWVAIGDVGYLSITSMEDLSRSGDEDDDRRAADNAMARVMDDLGELDALVIDVRANEGGWDVVALAIARWVAGSRTVAWSEQRRNGPGATDFGPWEDTFVEDAVSDAFVGPVVLLTSGGSFSAAETFALAMRVRDDVTIIGEPSSGHFSDVDEGELPNGWDYGLSNERYRAADGQIYETRGVPVDVPVALDVAAVVRGEDVMLDAALSWLAP